MVNDLHSYKLGSREYISKIKAITYLFGWVEIDKEKERLVQLTIGNPQIGELITTVIKRLDKLAENDAKLNLRTGINSPGGTTKSKSEDALRRTEQTYKGSSDHERARQKEVT
jgi:hypothetical protein